MRGEMQAYHLVRFGCGHVGRDSEGAGPKVRVTAFIRVAEVRSAKVVEPGYPKCPDCKVRQ